MVLEVLFTNGVGEPFGMIDDPDDTIGGAVPVGPIIVEFLVVLVGQGGVIVTVVVVVVP